jgi:hypothetical protein
VQARSIPVWSPPASTVQNTTVSNLVPQNSTQGSNTGNPPVQVSQASSAPSPVLTTAAKNSVLGIGLMWGAHVDVDLYVLPNKSSRELFFGYTQTREGTYFHDYRDANEGIGWEYVELKAPVDITTVSAWANYYSGHAWPVHGKVLVYCGGKAYYGQFDIAAHSGNRGGESNSRSSSPYWTKVDLLKIVGLK